MKKIYFLLNSYTDFNFSEYLHKHMDQSYSISFGESLPDDMYYYDLIVLWNYHKIVKGVGNKKNIVIFHSTNLPDGKGWAPIFNSLLKGDKYFYVTGILASDKVDAGDIIVQAKFEIKANYTAKYIRMWDIEICIILAKEILKRSTSNKLSGVKQTGIGSYNSKRKPQDNELNLNASLNDQVAMLRACEDQFPAFFIYEGVKYIVNIEPEIKPAFPVDLKITFFT